MLPYIAIPIGIFLLWLGWPRRPKHNPVDNDRLRYMTQREIDRRRR